MALQPNEVVLGKYRVISELGQGGMAATYRAWDEEAKRDVVIKTSLGERAPADVDMRRLQREAGLMTSFVHPSLPRFYDSSFDVRPIIVMEYVPGLTLSDLMRADTIGIVDAMRWVGQLLDALAYMHQADGDRRPSDIIIHRDIKPGNIIIRNDQSPSRAVLLDFGIARRLDRRTTSTLVQGFMTQAYAPIELYEPDLLSIDSPTAAEFVRRLRSDGFTSGPPTDIYSLAATFYHALTREAPWPPSYRLQSDPQSDPLSQPEKAGVPKALSDVLMKGLSVHPNDRYQTALEMAAALAQPPPPPRLSSPWITIPAGRYRMGSDLPELNEDQPSHPIELAAFHIGRYLVTQAEYQRFIDANPDQKAPSSSDSRAAAYCWRERRLPPGTERLPVVLVSWQEAAAYCQWLSEQTGKLCRLPTEAEWEVAAGWDLATQTARAYPWGPAFNALLCNAGRGRPSPVGHFSPQGDSPWGLADAVGNVWQWTTTGLWRYPYRLDGREDTATEEEHRIVRGGAFDAVEPAHDTLCARRIGKYRGGRFHNVGFRVVIDAAAYDAMATRPAAKTRS